MADTCKITWALTNTDVATISKDGVITPKKVGETMVTATVQGKSAQCKYTVTKHVVPVESVKVIPASFADDVNVGATKKLEIEVEPSDATYETVAWKSSNTAVATVSADGTVTCKGEGTCTITATIDGKEGTCKVTYSNSIVHVTSVSVTPATISENTSVGATKQLSATVLPADATDKTVTWKSSNTAVATVSSTGLVTCKGNGSCTITATADGKEGTCNVTYTKVPVTSVTVNPSTWTGEAIIDYSGRALVADILPENATDKTVTWESSDPNVAVVEQPEGSYTSYTSFICKGPGTATITATCDGKKGTCTVTFTKVRVQSVTVSPSTYTADYSLGATKQLTASVYPWTATYQTVAWKSSNTSVATVDNNGLVTCKGAGSATITATADGKSGTCEVTFEPMTVKDCMGNEYKTVKIGNQIWMAENLKCLKYDTQSERPGAVLKKYNSSTMADDDPYYWDASNESDWTESSFAHFLTDTDKPKLGYLYTWAAAVGFSTGEEAHEHKTGFTGKRQGICPNGWHLPTNEEWKTLALTVGGTASGGHYLKSKTSWYLTNEENRGIDSYFFCALPAGSGNNKGVRYVGRSANFWTPDAISVFSAIIAAFEYNEKKMFCNYSQDKVSSRSVRCVKN